LEGIGVNALIPLFSFFVKSDERLGGDTIANYIRDFFAFFHMPFTLPILLIFICVLFTFKGVIALYFNYLRTKICLEYDRTIRSALYKDTLYANWPYLSQQKVGHLETVIMTNVRMSSRLLESIARHVGVVTEFLIYLVVALNISKAVTLMTIVLGGLIFLIFKPILYRLRNMSKEHEELNKEVARHVNESIGGIKNIKAMGSEDSFIRISDSYFNLMRNLRMRLDSINNVTITFIQPISVIFISLVVAFTYFRTSYNLGALVAIIYLIQKMFAHIQSLQTFAQVKSK